MAFIELHYHSDALGTGVTVNVILPEKAKTLIGMNAEGGDSFKTLYLLHGLSDDHSIWMRRTSIERYAADFGIAVVMPNVGRSWYTDTAYGAKYFTFVTKELPSVCRNYFRGMSDKREDTLIAGLSMGGYGAVKAALSCPETFGGCASLSGALNVLRYRGGLINEEWNGIFGTKAEDYPDCFPDDVFYLVNRNLEQGIEFPKTYLWCGAQDYLLEDNHKFRDLLQEKGIAHRYEESEGNHSWKWWDLHIQDAIRYLLKGE
ncbi:MAG: esterase family protein [Clostridia bacterium]|nr:esterase family protein [Clostridia bacterium]